MRAAPLLLAFAMPAAPPAAAGQRDAEEAVAATHRAMACMLKRNPGRVRTYLEHPPGSPRAGVVAHYLYNRMGDCLTGITHLSISDAMGRGAAAELLIRAEHAGKPLPQPPVPMEAFGPLAPPLPVGADIAAAYDLARCTASIDPPGVAAVLAAERNSGAERAAFRSLGPTFSRCVAPGATFRTDRATLRPFLAEMLYQLYRRGAGREAA